ncbi:LOW QUALITY PROTEIN: uncharacterized protein LOC129580711 [Paramacrobiotus metropolitanus]|uniref:LOW QUALITY PROTEIN: uncharacterized protein LOC129580711 n=1 Tax=Paramacrobiotus metropolitanus TaxID=2943436 RepID=UPI0024459566|nr:LOW QUALITY PROTEIN: uncharacterized protein LOC129580711 [Paramacrobiotus metropolitanus]
MLSAPKPGRDGHKVHAAAAPPSLHFASGRIHGAQPWPVPAAPASSASRPGTALEWGRGRESGDRGFVGEEEGKGEGQDSVSRNYSETEIVKPVKPKRKNPVAAKCKQPIVPVKPERLPSSTKHSESSPPRRRPERKRRKDDEPGSPLRKISKRKSLQKLFRKALYFFEGLRTCNEIASSLPRLPSKKGRKSHWLDDSSKQLTSSSSESVTQRSRESRVHPDRGDSVPVVKRDQSVTPVREVTAHRCPVHSCTCSSRHPWAGVCEPRRGGDAEWAGEGRISIISDDWAFPLRTMETVTQTMAKASLSVPLMQAHRGMYPYVHPTPELPKPGLDFKEVTDVKNVTNDAKRPDLLPPNTPQPISDVAIDDMPQSPPNRTLSKSKSSSAVTVKTKAPSVPAAQPTTSESERTVTKLKPRPNYSQDLLVERPLRRRGRFYFRFRLNNRLQRRLSRMFRQKHQQEQHENQAKVTELPVKPAATPVVTASESSSVVSKSLQKSAEIIPNVVPIASPNSAIHPLFQMNQAVAGTNTVVEDFVTSLTSVLQTLNSELHRSNNELGRADEKLRAVEAENAVLRNKVLLGQTEPVVMPKISTESGSTLTPGKSFSQTETSKSETVKPDTKESKSETTVSVREKKAVKRSPSVKERSVERENRTQRKMTEKPNKTMGTPRRSRQESSAKTRRRPTTESSDNSVVYGLCRSEAAYSVFNQKARRPTRQVYDTGQLSTMSDDNLVQKIKENPYRLPSIKLQKSAEKIAATEPFPVVELPALPDFFRETASRNVSTAESLIQSAPVDSRFVSSCHSLTSTEKPPTATTECQTGPELLATAIGCQTSLSTDGIPRATVPVTHSSDSGVQVGEPSVLPDAEVPAVKVGVNISDSTIVDSETGKQFRMADGNLSDSVHSDEETHPGTGKLKVHSDVRRMSDGQLQAKLHSIQSLTDGATVHPLKDFLEYLFFLLGLRGPYAEEDYFIPVCHVEDSHILWNSWKAKLFTMPQYIGSDEEEGRVPLGDFAYYTIDRLFHFVNTYCVVRGWAFTLVNRESYEATGDLKAIYELTRKGVIEIPADRPKIFTDDEIQNRRIIRLFLMNSFRLDRTGQLDCIKRQKCLYYIHLFKNEMISNPSRDEIRVYRDLLQHCKVPEVASFSKKDRVLVEIIVRNWLSYKPILHVESGLDPDFQKLRAETKRWLTQTTLVNFRNRYGHIGALRMMAEKYLRGMLGTMQHEYRTFVSNILRIEQDPNTHRWRFPDKFLENVEDAGLEHAVQSYMVPYRFADKFALPHQEPVLTKKEAGREETFHIVENLYAQANRPRGGVPPKVDLRAVAKAQNYREQLKNPDVRRHLMERGKLGQPPRAGPMSPVEDPSEDDDLRSERTERTRRTQRSRRTARLEEEDEAVESRSDSSISVKLEKREIEMPRTPYVPPPPVQPVMQNSYPRSHLAASSPFLQTMASMATPAPRSMYQPPPIFPGAQAPPLHYTPRSPLPPPSVIHQQPRAPSSVAKIPPAPSVSGTQRKPPSIAGHPLPAHFSPNITRFVASKLHTPVKTKSPPVPGGPVPGFSGTDMFAAPPRPQPPLPALTRPSPVPGGDKKRPVPQRPAADVDQGFVWNIPGQRR